MAGKVRGHKSGPLLLQPFPFPPPSPAALPWASYLTPLPTIPEGSIQLNGWLQTEGLGAGMFLWHWRAHIPLSSGEQLNHSSLITVKAALAQAPTTAESSRFSLVVSLMFTSKLHKLAHRGTELKELRAKAGLLSWRWCLFMQSYSFTAFISIVFSAIFKHELYISNKLLLCNVLPIIDLPFNGGQVHRSLRSLKVKQNSLVINYLPG